MELDQLKRIWQSNANSPSASEVFLDKEAFLRSLRRKYRLWIGFLIWIFATLSWFTGIVVYNAFFTQKIRMHQEWAVVPFLAVPWILAIVFFRQFLKHRRTHARFRDSILSTLRAELDHNRLACLRVKGIASLYLIGIGPLLLVIYQLKQTGKMDARAITSMLVLFAALAAASGGMMAFHYFKKLLPQKRQLESLIKSYEASDDCKNTP